MKVFSFDWRNVDLIQWSGLRRATDQSFACKVERNSALQQAANLRDELAAMLQPPGNLDFSCMIGIQPSF
jgi:hypothetical protein